MDLDGLALPAPGSRSGLKVSCNFVIAVLASVTFQMVGAKLVPVAFDDEPLALGTIGALSSHVMNVANVNVSNACCASGSVGLDERFVRRSVPIRHAKVWVKRGEVNGN